MSNDLIIPITRQVTETIQVGVTLKELTMLRGDASTPGMLALLLAPLADDGTWLPDVEPVAMRREGTEAAQFQSLMLRGSVVTEGIDPVTDQIIQAYLTNGVDLRGLAVWDAAKVILTVQMASPATGEPAPTPPEDGNAPTPDQPTETQTETL